MSSVRINCNTCRGAGTQYATPTTVYLFAFCANELVHAILMVKFNIREPQIWREHLLTVLSSSFGLEPDWERRLGHGLAVEEEVATVINEAEYIGIEALDLFALRVAALLHGALAHFDKPQPQPRRIQLSESFRNSVVPLLQELQTCSDEQIEMVFALLSHCEDHVFQYPFSTLGGTPAQSALIDVPDQLTEKHLSILREADARVHSGSTSLRDSIREWMYAGIPWSPSNQMIVPTVMWHESIAGNIRLLVKRTMIDSFTKQGKKRALEVYLMSESVIRDNCDRLGLQYMSEIYPISERSKSCDRIEKNDVDVTIVEYHDITQLKETFRLTTLLGDSLIKPYQTAEIESVIANLEELSPLALYVLQDRLDKTLELHDALMVRYGVSLFDLSGLLKVRYRDNSVFIIAPPIVETYLETQWDPPRLVSVIVDGLHRCVIAQKLGIESIRVLGVKEVPVQLIAVPVTWIQVQEIKCIEQIPKKREYRYEHINDFPDVSQLSNICVTEENFAYFFYRDFSHIGSGGPRNEQ